MFPLIIESKNIVKVEEFIQEFIQQQAFSPYFIYKISPLKTEVSIDQIRSIAKELILQSKEKRLFIIYSFETASHEAQNAFLKTLEEKTNSAQFILCVTTIDLVLPTIISRSKVVRLKEQSENIGIANAEKLVENIEKKGLSTLKEVSSITKETAISLIDELIFFFEKRLPLADIKAVFAIKKLFELKKFLIFNNANPQLTIDSFIIFYFKHFQKE